MKRYSVVVFLILSLGFIIGQTQPAKSLHRNPPRTWALTNATVHTEPGKSIIDGTIIIRNGVIQAVGRNLKIPNQATALRMDGKHIYAGFINGLVDVSSKADSGSLELHWNTNMRAHLKASDIFKGKKKDLDEMRSLGFTTAHITPRGGIFQGNSALIQLNENPKVLSSNLAEVVEFKSGGWGAKEYPTSLLGAIAFIRQGLYDAKWYDRAQSILAKHPEGNEQIKVDKSLNSLSKSINNKHPFIFRTSNELYINRASNIAQEFDLNLWLKGNGYEYRRIDDLPEVFMVIPVDFPAKPKVSNPHNALQYSTKQLKHWDMAPDNLSRLAESGFEFALTTDGLKRKRDFKKNISKAVQRGLSKTDALASLTTIPAKAFGESKRLGRIAPGYIANLVVTDESYFNRKSIINSVWIEGDQFVINPEPIVEAQGKWTVKEREKSWELEISEQNLIYTASAKKDGESFSIYNLSIDQDRISFVIKDSLMANMGAVRFLGNIEKSSMNGVVVYPDNNRSQWSANLNARMKKDIVNSSSDNASNLEVFYPEGAYGIDDGIPNPKTVLIDDATIWTSGPKGILKGYDILFQNGKIKDIAKNIYLTDQNAVIIDGKGKHVTPGLIDAHSHMAGESINEGFQNVTAEVRMRDVIDPNDIAMYRALAGGLTTINLLHGSANPIGGQNVVMKLRWGSFSNDLIFKEAPQGIKFALGENVKRKRSYGRYPETRMGVEQVIRDAFVAARDYEKLWNTYNKDAKLQRTKIPPRRDLELDAMVEIMKGDRLVHSHSYRQDEILMLTRIAEDFGFTIGTFQHVLEGYKVAERLKEHGAGASTFSDWWAYKYEVIDAIPFNGTLMADVGVNVSFNSDSDELARRMNLEAAKAVKYGGISEEKALEFVTINPAIQLGIENKVGSLEIGKDADFAIWSGHPLSNYSICEQTWIEGKQYFSLEQDKFFRARDKKLRNDIIQKILTSNETGTHIMKPDSEEANHFHSCKTEGSHSHEHGGAH